MHKRRATIFESWRKASSEMFFKGARMSLLKVENLKKYFSLNKGWFKKGKLLKAVDDISFALNERETLGIVGESGCGKTTAAKTILRLYDLTDGRVEFQGRNLHDLSRKETKEARKDMQIIFQNPVSSLDPRMKIRDIVGEGLDIHGLTENRAEKIVSVLERVGISSDYIDRYPHEFSGGQRQRIGIARALILEPKMIIADEPVSALDVSMQAQIINLLKELQEEYNMAYLLIAHDLSVVKHVSHRIAVMYLGKIVELAEAKDLCNNPLHPYTQALLSAVPVPNPEIKTKKLILKGDIPSPLNPPAGCRFHTRCPLGKNTALLVYILQGLAFFSVLTVIVGAIINYVKMKDVRGTWLESHFHWQISTFWWGFILWPLIGFFLLIYPSGIAVIISVDLISVIAIILSGLIFFADTIWVIYRIIKGLIFLNKEKEI